MHDRVEAQARRVLAPLLGLDLAPADLDQDADLASDYGLTSLNKVLFLTALCEDTGVDLSRFTEHDVARMRTLRDVTMLLSPHAEGEPAR